MAFADAWKALQSQLREGAIIHNWTVHSGRIGEPFQIEVVAPDAIVVNPPGAAAPQSVRRKDFEVVYEMWDDYLNGSIPRKTFTPLTRCSKYVISTLHWLEEQSSGRLP